MPFLIALCEQSIEAVLSENSLTIEGDGASSLGTIALQPGADMRFNASTPSYTFGDGHDILLGQSLGENKIPLLLALNHLANSDGMENAWEQLHFGGLELNVSTIGSIAPNQSSGFRVSVSLK